MNRLILTTSLVSTFLLLSLSEGFSQDQVRIENPFSSVSVATDQNSGRFYFATGAQHGFTRYTYRGSGNSQTITSNVVFRIRRNNTDFWYTNVPNNALNGGVRPSSGQGEAIFAPYDSLYRSPAGDTLEVIWEGLNAFDITMRFVAEAPRHEYDNGADILLEFDYKINPNATSSADLGIFMMLDVDNGTVTNSDKASILTDRGYYPTGEPGALFQKQFGGIPEYYLAGRFRYREPLAKIFSVHRLTGTSLGGAPLTEPDEFAIGRWQDLRGLTWFVNGSINSTLVEDIATTQRWEGLGSRGLVRTAFGTTSDEGNNFYHCRDSNVFVVVRTERLVEQAVENGPYEPSSFDFEMWVTSLVKVVDQEIDIGLRNRVRSFPDDTRRLRIAGGDPAMRTVILKEKETKKLTWRINVDATSNDTLAEFDVLYRDTSGIAKPLVPLLDGCTPKVSFKGAFIPPPPDSRDPVIQPLTSGRDGSVWWTFRTFDRHPGYLYDSGLDKIEVIRNDGNNFSFTYAPNPFDRCDTTETVQMRAEVVDSTKAALIVVRVTDCEGNREEIEQAWSPRPDTFVPSISLDSIGHYNKGVYPCAFPVLEAQLRDVDNITQNALDQGFGSITMTSDVNVQPLEINFDRGGNPIEPFDSIASFRITVVDTMLDASAEITYRDLAGNSGSYTYNYCTLPDTLQPEFVAIGSGPTSWIIEGSDSSSWDRGLAEIVEVSRTNMNVGPLGGLFGAGDRSFGGLAVSVGDDAWPAELTLELRDTRYDVADPSTHAGHSRRITLTWDGIADTLAPEISITRDLTVAAPRVVFNVSVRDSHTVAGNPYMYDRGIEEVTWSITPNMSILTPLSYTDNRRGATMQVEVVDIFSLNSGDTICVNGVDSAGNVAPEVCRIYPIEPDDLAPIFRGEVTDDRTALVGLATDQRTGDRGLAEVYLRATDNVAAVAPAPLSGAVSFVLNAPIADPTAPYSGEIVVRDLHSVTAGLDESSKHTLLFPFTVPVLDLEVYLPEIVEGGEDFPVHIVSQSDFSGDDVSVVRFSAEFSDNGTLLNAGGPRSIGSVIARTSGRETQVSIITKSGTDYRAGDTLGTLTMRTERPTIYDMFYASYIVGSGESNLGERDTLRVTAPGESEYSELILPPPYVRLSVDSMTVINGDCSRALSGGSLFERPTGVHILSVYPNPTVSSREREITVHVRDVPEEGVTLMLYGANGTSMAAYRLEGDHTPVASGTLTIPDDLPAGLYYLQAKSGEDAHAVPLIVE